MEENKIDWLNRLHHWGFILVSRIVGTKPATDHPTKGIRDVINKTLYLRAEVNAQTNLLIKKGLFTEAEFNEQLQEECRLLCAQYEKAFPGVRASELGIEIFDTRKFAETAKGWPL